MSNQTREQRLQWLAADMFDSETRRGYLAGSTITKQEYIQRFVEKNKNADIDQLEEIGDIVWPSTGPTAYEIHQLTGKGPPSETAYEIYKRTGKWPQPPSNAV
jgi:hypothetical protein